MERLEPIFSSKQVSERIAELASEISQSYKGVQEPVVFVCVLKGAFVFFADLLRQVDLQPEIEFVRLASYGAGTTPSQEVTLSQDVEVYLQGKHVLIVEDIVDTGRTVDYLRRELGKREVASLGVSCLIHKLERREVDADPDFVCFTVDSGFVVGCGLDYAERYRGLSTINKVIFSQEKE